jgi:hypothetical protein
MIKKNMKNKTSGKSDRNNIEHSHLQGLITEKQSACCDAPLYGGTKRYPIFRSPDRLWAKYPSLTSYNYCGNNPIMFIDPTGESGEITINHKEQTVIVNSKLYFYGNEATRERSKQIADGIATHWNSTNATVKVKGKEYKIQFKITYETVSEEKAEKLSVSNKSLKNNFVRVEKGGSKSSLTWGPSSGSNSFWFNIDDGLNSTTFAHEFGHGLGFDHPKIDLSNETGKPHIMIPRQTPYGKYWSITNKDGVRVVNPNSRRVQKQQVIDAVINNGGDISNKIFNKNGTIKK